MPPVPKPPVVFIDAAEEPWSRIHPVLERRRGDLTEGAVMHVRTGRDDLDEALTGWCAAHALHVNPTTPGPADLGRSFVIRAAAIHPEEES